MSDQPPWDPFSQQAQPNDQEQYPPGQPQSGQPQYPQAQPQFGQPQFGQQQFGQQQFGQQQFGQQFPYSQPPQGPYGPMPQLPFGPPGGFRPRRTWRRRHTVFSVVGSLIGLFVVIGVLSTVSSRGNQAPVASAASASAAALAPAASASGAGNVATNTVATFTGSGTENTAKFTVKATWKLQYSFNCSNFGQTGNFAVLEDGGQDISLTINDVALSRSGSAWAYNDAGTHYLEIASQCDWKVKVLD